MTASRNGIMSVAPRLPVDTGHLPDLLPRPPGGKAGVARRDGTA